MNLRLSESLRSSAKHLGFFANMRQKPLANFATAGGKSRSWRELIKLDHEGLGS